MKNTFPHVLNFYSMGIRRLEKNSRAIFQKEIQQKHLKYMHKLKQKTLEKVQVFLLRFIKNGGQVDAEIFFNVWAMTLKLFGGLLLMILYNVFNY